MPRILLTDEDDPRLAVYRNLPQANLTERSGRFVVEGWLLVQRLLASGCEVDSILLEESRLATFGAEIPDGVTIYLVPSGLIERIIGFGFHRGVLGCGRRPARPALAQLLPPPRGTDREPVTLVVAVDIQDPTNLGGILRNAAAFGAQGVLLSRQCADPYSRRVLRVSMGTVFRLQIVRSDDLLRDLRSLQEAGDVQFIATVLEEGAEPLDQARRPARVGLLFGNEGHGLPPEYREFCARRVTLPMAAGIDSLNAAVASGIFLYHFTRPHHFAAADARGALRASGS